MSLQNTTKPLTVPEEAGDTVGSEVNQQRPILMSRTRLLTNESALYILAFLLALSLRFLHLGAAPLSDAEANWALQALHVARGSLVAGGVSLGPQPAYVFLTAILFQILGSSNTLARFWPALMGSLMTFLPLFFIRTIEKEPENRISLLHTAGLIMAFGLALDPGLTTVARQAGSPVMAASFLLLAFGWWRIRQPVLTGLFAGMALLSGPQVLAGLLGLSLAWGAARILGVTPTVLNGSNDQVIADQDSTSNSKILITVLITTGATILLIGTFFLAVPQGLAAWFDTLPAYLKGWVNVSDVPPLRLLAVLLIYQPLALIFGLITSGRILYNWKNDTAPTWLLLWGIIALILVVIYPSHQVADLVWVLVALWALASLELAYYLQSSEGNLISSGQASLIFILLALFWLTLAGLGRAVPGTSDTIVRLGVLFGILALGILTSVLISLGWSRDIAQKGLAWGISAGFTVYMISALWSASQLHENQPVDLWNQTPGTGQSSLMLQTLGDLSEWQTGFRNQVQIVSEVDTPSMRWLLRDYPNVQFTSQPTSGDMPPVIISLQTQAAPTLASSYRGQDFVWWTRPDWTGTLPPNPIAWLVFREAPVKDEHVILWARDDIFPGGTSEQPQTTNPNQQ